MTDQNLPQTSQNVVDMLAMLADAQDINRVISDSDSVQFLKLTKNRGDWVYGQEETEVDSESLWAVDPTSFSLGYINWGKADFNKNELLGEINCFVMRPGEPPLPPVASLPHKEGGEWRAQNGFIFSCIKGPDEGVTAIFRNPAKGARREVSKLLDAIIKRGHTESDFAPVVQLKSRSYRHKKYGEIFVPDFVIVDWVSPALAAPNPNKTVTQAIAPPEPNKPVRTRTRK